MGGCFSCQERAKLIQQGVQNLKQGKPIAPQVNQFKQTIRNDLAAIKARIVRPGGRGR